MEGRYRKLLLSLLVLVLVVSIGKESYALFTSSVSSTVQNYGTGTLKLSYSNSVVSLNNAYPMSDSDGMNMGSGIITITNTGTLAYKFDVKIDVSSSSTLSNDLIKVSIDEQNPAFLSTDGNVIIRDIILNPGSSRSFSLKLWIDSSATSSQVLGKKFVGNLTSTGIAVRNVDDSVGTVLVGPDKLYDYIKENADTTTTIDFSKTSELNNTNGIYMTTDTEGNVPVYYYRGNVDNRVIFANFCWRIVRTTETGGVKLIYDGVPSNGQCNNTGDNSTIGKSAFSSTKNDAKYVGYMYGSNIDDKTYTDESTIKKTIDNWYETNMTSYTSQLEDTVFCNDRSYTTSGSTLYFGAYTRLGENRTPTLKCQNTKDKFTINTSNGNGALTYPVGLITADEMAYAGGVDYAGGVFSSNSSFYLYTGQYYWALSPYRFDSSVAYEFSVDSIGSLVDEHVVYSSGGVRPSVSLQPGIVMTGGSGTAVDPFVIAKPSLYDYIKNNADTTTTIDFSQTSESSNTNGIYTTTDTDSGKPIYYYRGNVDNRVIFANFCWRIVRTTETGGVKLIYDGVPSNGQCNNTGDNSTIGKSTFNSSIDNAKYVGYMYGSSIDDETYTHDSDIKTTIDNWYETNMTSYTSQLEDTVFCNDRSYTTIYTTIGSNLHFGARNRLISNKTPTLKCQNVRDKFTKSTSNGNGALEYPVGLITADEMAYAGGVYGTSLNRSFYLYTGKYYWALSPAHFSDSIAFGFSLDSVGALYDNRVTDSLGVRPSVSLQPGIAMTGGGSGTAAEPFVIG